MMENDFLVARQIMIMFVWEAIKFITSSLEPIGYCFAVDIAKFVVSATKGIELTRDQNIDRSEKYSCRY